MSANRTTRRAMLAGAAKLSAAAAIGTGAALAEPADDPIFAAIEAHRNAAAAFEATVTGNCRLQEELPRERRRSRVDAHGERIVEDDDPRWIASERNVDRSADAASDAAVALVNVEPATLAGVVALLNYHVEVEARGDYWPDNICGDPDKGEDEGRAPMHRWVMLNVARALEQMQRRAAS